MSRGKPILWCCPVHDYARGKCDESCQAARVEQHRAAHALRWFWTARKHQKPVRVLWGRMA